MGKPVMITRLVDTMATSPRPTRAEATDVANAVLDGCDALLLGSETLRGKWPADTVATLARICGEAEHVYDHQHHYDWMMEAAMEAEKVGLVWGGEGRAGLIAWG